MSFIKQTISLTLVIIALGLVRPNLALAACTDASQSLVAQWSGPGLSQVVRNSTEDLAITQAGTYTATVSAPNCNWDDTFIVRKNSTDIFKHKLQTDEKATYQQGFSITVPARGNKDVYTVLIEVSDTSGVLAREQATINVLNGTSTTGGSVNTPTTPNTNTSSTPGGRPPGVNIPDSVPITNIPIYDSSPTTPELIPLIQSGSVPQFLASLVKFLLLLVAGLSVLVILIGAFRMVMSQGKTEALAAGKRTITWAIIGLVVSLLSYSIVAILQSVLGIN